MAIQQMFLGTPSGGGGGGAPGSFAHQDVGSISGTFGNGNNPRSASKFTAQFGIDYGQQNTSPFNTSQDWNSTIEKAYSYTAYAGRTQAAAFAALMHRPTPQGSWPYSNSWESCWWINASGGNGDLLIVVFNAMRTLNGIKIENTTSTYGNSNPIVYAAALTGTPGSFYQTPLGSVSWGSASGSPSLSSATISISSVTVQAVALWIEGTTGWTRTETIRFMK